MNSSELALYRKDKILQIIGKSTMDQRQILNYINALNDPYLNLSIEQLNRYMKTLSAEGSIFSKQVNNIYVTTGGLMRVYRRSRFDNRNIQVSDGLPFNKNISRMMGYAVIKPTSKGKRYTENDAVKSMGAQTNRNSISIQSGMNTVFYSA